MGICNSVKVTYKNETMTNENLQFTRYLYPKDEVKISLMISLLKKKEDEAVFWAYELYYSGFYDELTNLLWKIYYDFYYTLNGSFEEYLYTKLKKNLKNIQGKEKVLYMIINNFLIRPYNLDVFTFRNITKMFAIDKKYIDNIIISQINTNYDQKTEIKYDKILLELLYNKNYLLLAEFIMNDIIDLSFESILTKILGYFSKRGVKINTKKELGLFEKMGQIVNKRILLVSKIMRYALLINNALAKFGKNIYVQAQDEDVIMYETIQTDLTLKKTMFTPILPAYKILPLATLYYIDKDNYLSLFQLKRETIKIKDVYYYEWLYYCYDTPVWFERITKYSGYKDEEKNTIEFTDSDLEDEFYSLYNYETDEQKKEVQQKTIQDIIEKREWVDFYDEFHNKDNSLLDEDSAEYIKNFYKIKY